MKTRPRRSGYAMLLVLVFIALVLSFFSLSYRHLATALRAETFSMMTRERDQGSLAALAAGLTLLETGLPPSDPYVCATSIATSAGATSYTVTFASEGGAGAIGQVEARPTGELESPEAMPATFAEE